MKKVAIALHSFIHNHVDVNEGDIVTGLSDAALSDLEKNGLVRFEDQDDGSSEGKEKSPAKSAPKSATSPSKKTAANKSIDQTAAANAITTAKDVTKTAESSSADMTNPESGNGANTANDSQSDSASGIQSE